MAGFPAPYAREKDFSEDLGSASDHNELNDELDTLGSKLNTLILQLQELQRDDGKLGNSEVHPQAFDSASLALMSSSSWTVKGAWATATAYVVGDLVSESGESYVCAEAHTSGTFSTDLAAIKWIPLSALAASVTAFSQTLLDDADASTWLATLGFSAFVKTLIDDADASTFLGTLGFSAFGKTLIDDADAAAGRTTLGAADDTLVAKLAAANVFTKTQTWTKGSDVASASALSLGDGNYFDITGTDQIDSIGTKGVGTLVTLHFDASLTITNSADIVLPFGRDWITKAGDELTFIEYATGDWRCIAWPPPVDIISEDVVSSPVAKVTRTNLDFTPYKYIVIVLDDVFPDTGNVAVHMRATVSGAEQSGASDYRHCRYRLSDGGSPAEAGSTGDSKIPLNHNGISASNRRHHWTVTWYDLDGVARAACLIDGKYNEDTSNQFHMLRGGGEYTDAGTAIDGFTFEMSSGNISEARITIYGVRR